MQDFRKKRVTCEKCGFDYSIFTLKVHKKNCNGRDRRINSIEERRKSNFKIKCNKCGFDYSTYTIKRHQRTCDGKDRRWVSNKQQSMSEHKQPDGKYKCITCNRLLKTAAALGKHIKITHDSEGVERHRNRPNYFLRADGYQWNKGKTVENCESVRVTTEKLKRGYATGELVPYFKNNKHKPESIEKMRKARIEYLQKHPNSNPYVISHSSRKSRIECIFEWALKKNNITGWIYNYPISIYNYDFGFPDLKIDVETDGGTHLKERVKKIDERRDKFSRDNGWVVLRFTEEEVNKNVQNCINILKDVIEKRRRNKLVSV